MYTRALVSHRMGMAIRATADVADARGFNPAVAQYLLDPDAELPDAAPREFMIGGTDEAADYAQVYGDIWRATPGAMEWLRQDERRGKKPRRETAGATHPTRHRTH
jgi:hypothetical protein